MENNKQKVKDGMLEVILSWSERKSGDKYVPTENSYRLHRSNDDYSNYQSSLMKGEEELSVPGISSQKSAPVQIFVGWFTNYCDIFKEAPTAVTFDKLVMYVSSGLMKVHGLSEPLQRMLMSEVKKSKELNDRFYNK